MQQILKFNIELFDVRMRSSIDIINDTNLVQNIQINKSTTLDNIATITFIKSRAYEMLPMESILKLYNYVKIELTLKNYGPDSESKFYFSGFIQTINKASQFGQIPSATVTITVGDYASLLKTTFYTKNLTFLEILNQAVPEFRMINLSEFLGDATQKLLDKGFYSPPQLGFIFFTFLFFKFMYKIVYDEDGSTKKTEAPGNREIFKKFKIYMPFGFDIDPGAEDRQGIKETMLKGQEQSLTIYKQLQGVALDLFKYIYPEPIFEFSTYETEESVILQIRLTPFMKFDRKVTPPKEIKFGEPDNYIPGLYATKSVSTQEYAFAPNSYNTIERYEFGFRRIKSIQAELGRSPSSLLRAHLNEDNLITTIQASIGDSKNLDIEDLVASDKESDEITEKFFNVIPMDTTYLESLNMTRAASSVVNVIWTVPTTDTAVLKMSGRELVYAYLEQRLKETGGIAKFGNYVYQQFNDGFDPNPIFLMDYRKVFGQDFVSGDMNYFGFREFEIKWNYLSTEYNTVNNILNFIDKAVLAKARAASKDTSVTRMLDEAMRKTNDPTAQSSYISKNGKVINPRRAAKIFADASHTVNFDISPPSGLSQEQQDAKMAQLLFPEKFGGRVNVIQKMEKEGWKTNPATIRQTSRAGNLPKPSKNKSAAVNEAKKALYNKALKRYGDTITEKDLSNVNKIIELLMRAKVEDARLMGGFVAKINGVVGEAYRENEHLYDCNIVKPIDLTILPGMIVESSTKNLKDKPQFKGYVTSISHSIDFNGATMKTAINLSRTASDDSGIVAKVGP